MNPQVQNYYSHYSMNSEVYRKLYSLSNDVKISYQHDRDETDSIQEIIEILKSILIMESIEEYFSNNKTDFYYFMGEFSKDVITYILYQDNVYGENGNELALELLFHFVELFFKFHKNKEYTTLFENIHKIFEKNLRFFSPIGYGPVRHEKKSYTYQQFNEEYCNDFKKEIKIEELFKVGDKVDVLIKKETHQDLEKKMWVRGEITKIEDGKYTIRYPKKKYYDEVKYPIEGKNVRGLGTMTTDWDWRLGLKKFDLVDCYDRGRWYPATVYKIEEYNNEYGIYKEYKIGFRLYPDKFIENKEYDYNTILEYYVFWDNNNANDHEGNNYYGDHEQYDEDLAFYSKRIQKFQSYSSIQKECLNNQLNNNYNNYFTSSNGQIINVPSQNNKAEEKIKNMTEMLCYEVEESNEDESYDYEKNGKKNIILGKNNGEFKYFFALLLKKMEEAGYFGQIASFLKDKPSIIELYNIFYILSKCEPFLHKGYFNENRELFNTAFIDSFDSLSSKDIKILQKDYIDYCINFLTKVNYIITGQKVSKKCEDIKFQLTIKLIKSSIFDKKLQGLKMLAEYLRINSDEENKKYIIDIIKTNNIIKELFGSNYHTQIINKSNEIIEFMLKNNELAEDDIKMIWSLTEQGDLEAKMTIIKLISDNIAYLNEKLCNIILQSINIEKITTFAEKEIDLIKNLAIKVNDKKFIAKCCQIFCEKVFKINDLKNLEKSSYVNILANFFEKDEICCKKIINICEGNLKENKNVLIVLFLFEAIIKKNIKKIHLEIVNEINMENDFISNEIYHLIDNNKLLFLFKDNFDSYKQRAKEMIKDNKMNEKNLMIDGYSHEYNMKVRIDFLVEIIPILYPKFDFFSLMKEICLVNPIFESDKSFFYDFMEKYISEDNKDSINATNIDKIVIKEQLFNMIGNENKNDISPSQFNLYIQLFLEINSHKNFLTFFKQDNTYVIDMNKNVDINDLFGIEKLWDLLFELISTNLSKKLIKIIYSLYETKKEIQSLLDKCVNLIKDSKNITYNKLQQCINILKYIINNSEKNKIIDIKSHKDILKDCLICLNLEVKKNNNSSFNFNRLKSNSSKNKGVLYGTTKLNQIKQILAEKYNMEEKNITVKLKNENVTTYLNDDYLNKNLEEIFNLNREGKRGLSPLKLKFTGNYVEKEYLVIHDHVNNKYENMIRDWFNYFTNGAEIMDKDAIINYISKLEPDKPADETNSLYVKLMKYDKGSKSCLLDDEFSEFYIDLARSEEQTVWEHIKKMGYGKNLEKSANSGENNYIIEDKNKLPRYILGNDIKFHEALILLFHEFYKNINIFEFLFFLCTNEKKYEELLDNSNKLIFVEKQENINYLEELYNLVIIESFIQDLEASKVNLNKLFLEKINQNMNNIFGPSNDNDNKELKIAAKKYLPFDDEKNLEKKRNFLVALIEEGGYVKIIKNVEKTLELIDNNVLDEEKIKIEFCQHCIVLINLLYDSFLNKDINKDNKKNQQNDENDDVFFLFEKIDITQLISSNDEKENAENIDYKISKLREIVMNTNYLTLIQKLILFLLKFNNEPNMPLNMQCFKLFLKLVTNNEKLFEQMKSDENIKINLTSLIKNNIINREKFFVQSLSSYIKSSSKNKKEANKLDYQFLSYLFSISNSLFNELIFNEKNEKIEENKSKSFVYFFEYFSNLLEEILKNNKYGNINDTLNEEFITQIYTILYNNIKEKNLEKKLPEDVFLGIMRILITIIKANKTIKEKIISRKINNETLFDIIYSKLMPEKEKEEIQETNYIDEDDLDINNLLSQIKENNDINSNFVKIEDLSEIINLVNSTKKEEQEEIITNKVYIVYKNFIIACLTDCTNIDLILKLLKIFSSFDSNKYISTQNSNLTKKKSKKEQKRCGYVGLKNIGCICYMNSILQQMYMVIPFRNAIISSDDKKDAKPSTSIYNNTFFDDNLLHQLQKMYTFLTFSEKQAYNPKNFCSAFKDLDGQPINIHLQQDSQEFYNNLCDKIESFLKATKYKYIIHDIFTGKTCSSVKCESCNNISNKFEDFYNLSLEVKNINNLYDSLKKFTEPEKIEQFKCETCKKTVTISKRTSLAKLPNVLFVHLKRFYMNYETEATEKINSKFEFPTTINLKNFCVEEITKIQNKEQESDSIYPKLDDYYEYELKGINVHLGNAEGGHYISFIDVQRDGNNNQPNLRSSIEKGIIKSRWLKFNDSIVTEFDTKDIPIECYGGFIEDNINNENRQNAYLLIYERKKKTPIKIVIEKENEEKYLNNEKYKIVSFPKEQKNFIDKSYDISYSNNETKNKEDDLYNIIFKDEEKEECYYYLPYYNIEKNVLKENFIEVMNKNKKFNNRKIVNTPIDLSKYKDKWNEILLSVITTDDFNILDKKYKTSDLIQFIDFFKEEIFHNNMYKESLYLDDGQKIILNDRANILLKKIILPLINMKEKTQDVYDLLNKICLIFADELNKIFEWKNAINTGIFNSENAKLVCDSIYTIMSLYDFIPRSKMIFKTLFMTIKSIKINKDRNFAMRGNNISFSAEDDENEKENIKETSTYYYFDLIYKIFKLNNDFVSCISDKDPIFNLIIRIKKNTHKAIRIIVYDIIIYLLQQYYSKQLRKRNMEEKTKIQKKILDSDEEIIQLIFNEKNVLMGTLLELLQNDEESFSVTFNKKLILEFFNYAKKKMKLIELLNILFKIINIKDRYTIERLETIMGVPNLIIKNKKKIIIEEPKKEQEEEEEIQNRLNFYDEDEEKEEQKKNSEKEIHTIFPKFGFSLIEENNQNEIYKYSSIYKLYQSNCLLAQLFPSSDLDDNVDEKDKKNKEQKLTEKERNNFIYKLLQMSLLGEGNYGIFKYVYLTQSRFIKYNNLYEEMIDILSQEKNPIFDLKEIKINAEICIKRINYEIKKLKHNISTILGKELVSDFNENEIPPLPKNMEEKNGKSEEIEEFTGFYQVHIPDKITKVEYNIRKVQDNISLILVQYYTTSKDIEKIKNPEKNEPPQLQSPSTDEIIPEKKEKEKKSDEEKEEEENYKYPTNKIYYRNKIEDNEEKIISKLINLYKLSSGKTDKLTVINEVENNSENKTKEEISLIRAVLYSNSNLNVIWNGKFEEKEEISYNKYNYYFPKYSTGKIKKMVDLLVIYRRNMNLDFLKNDNLLISVNNSKSMNESNGFDDSF